VWAARAGWGPASFRGFDRYGDDTGEVQWRLAGIVPLIKGRGPDVDRSAAGRLAAEGAMVPAALLGPSVTWQEGEERDTVIATWHLGGHVIPTTLHIADDGTLTKVTLMRWGSPNGPPAGEHPFAALLSEPVTFDGITVPTRWEAGWFYGTPAWEKGRFFEAKITGTRFV
jgi:hypothetical protein